VESFMPQHPTQSKARRGRVYELFVLGELIGGPHHGYLLHEILGKILGPFRKASWGVLYPLIHRLEEAGLIVPDARTKRGDAEGKRGQRHLYRITKAGRDRFQALMLESVPYEAYDTDLFIGKLGYFDHITIEQQKAILQHHQSYLQAQEDYMREALRQVMAETDIPVPERQRIQWVTEFRLGRLEAEIAWVHKALTDLK
jgi:DNA-binding PadR family transcriptional regulator